MAPARVPVWLIDSHAYVPPKEFMVDKAAIDRVWSDNNVSARAHPPSLCRPRALCTPAQPAPAFPLPSSATAQLALLVFS